MSTPQISIIVPVYKVEKYLRQCVDSILTQTFTDFELLLIDDGSPDKSGEICDEYAEKDVRVRVYHKENGGVASARQYGTNRIKGKYVIHVDPDDWVELDMLDRLYSEIINNDADIVICDYFSNKDNIQTTVTVNSSNEKEILIAEMIMGKVHGSLCNKLVKTDLYIKNNIGFIPGLNCREDLLVMIQLTFFSTKIKYLPQAFYHYCVNSDGFVGSNRLHITDAYQKDIRALLRQIEMFCVNHNITDKDILSAFRYRKVNDYCLIALSGSLSEYQKDISIWDDITNSEIQQTPMTIQKKIAGLFLKSNQRLLLNLLREIRSIYIRIKYF